MYSTLSKKRRQAILDQVKAQLAAEQEGDMLAEINLSDWNAAFDLLNTQFWSGTLEKIPVVSVPLKRKKAYGLYHHTGQISLACDMGRSAIELLGTLLHEMCHHHVHLTYGHGKKIAGKTVIGHGKHWKHEMRRVGFLGKVSKYSGKERFSSVANGRPV